MRYALLLLSALIFSTVTQAQVTWKKYNSSQFGLSFDNPEEWYLDENEYGLKSQLWEDGSSGYDSPYFVIHWNEYSGNSTYAEIQKEAEDYVLDEDDFKLEGSYIQTTVGSKIAIKFIFKEISGTQKVMVHVVIHNHKILFLGFGDDQATFDKSYTKYFQHMLSSIKYIGGTTSSLSNTSSSATTSAPKPTSTSTTSTTTSSTGKTINFKRQQSSVFNVSLNIPTSWPWAMNASTGISASSPDNNRYPSFLYEMKDDMSEVSNIALKTKAYNYCLTTYNTDPTFNEAAIGGKTVYIVNFVDEGRSNMQWVVCFLMHRGKFVVITFKDYDSSFEKNYEDYFKPMFLSMEFE